MAKINTTIHDNFIRAILADKEIAREYFSNYLPAIVSNQLDFSTLTQMPETYLSKNLQKSMSDIVYSCKRNDNVKIKVCLLIEHKSYIDKYTPVQIGSYIFSGYEKQITNKEKLSIIIPVLLYHGKDKWEYKTVSGLFENLQSEWKKFLPDFDYVYNNLGDLSDEHIEILENKFLTASLLTLKHTFQKGWLELNAYRILILTEEANENLQRNLTVYLFANSGLEEQKIIELLQSVPSTLKHKVMSTLEIFEKKGLDRGIEKGIELSKANFIKNLLLNTDFSFAKIAMLAEVSEELVIKIRSEIDLINE